MAKCKHCNGTGEAPDVLTLECISCQRKVKVTFTTTADLITKCENVRCDECLNQGTPPMTHLTDEMRAQGWVEHDGHICPCDPYQPVNVMLRNGWISDGPTLAGYLRWDKGRTPESAADSSLRRNDIIAYRMEPSQ